MIFCKQVFSIALNTARKVAVASLVMLPALSSATENIAAETKLSLLKKIKFNTDLKMRGSSFSEGTDESQTVQLVINPKADLEFHKYFKLRADMTFNLRSSRIQARFQNANFQTFNLNELVVIFNPKNYFELLVGAIDQRHLDNQQLITQLSFPGAMLSKSFVQTDEIQAKLKAQYTIPTSSSLETDRSESEGLPTFKTAGLEFKWKPLKWIDVNANINYFSFSDLPSVVAYRSDRLGNQVTGDEPTESFFRYGFRGVAQTYSLNIKYTDRISSIFKIKTVENADAPSDRSRAQNLSLGFEFKFKHFSVKPSLSNFYSESNSSPAVYNSAILGHNNREGFAYGIQVELPQKGFSVTANYVQADLIQVDASQRDLTYLSLYLEVVNVQF